MSGGSVSYYKVHIDKPTTLPEPYYAECNDIIEALQMTQSEANVFKEIWRTANGRANNNGKPDNDEVRAAEKCVFFSIRQAVRVGADVDKIISGMNTK